MDSKICKKCGVPKPLDQFRVDRGFIRGECKECAAKLLREYRTKDPELHNARARAWSKNNPEKRNATKRAWHKKNKVRLNRERRAKMYGISVAQLDLMQAQQNNRCASCGDEFVTTPEIDHCHKSGAVRGLLCCNCNAGLGMFQDSLARVLLAARYLQKFQG